MDASRISSGQATSGRAIVNNTLLAIAGICMFLAAQGAGAALRFSYQADMSDAKALNEARLEARVVYIAPGSVTDHNSLACCQWLSGPGAGVQANATMIDKNADDVFKVDLSDIPPGSTRLLKLMGGSSKSAAETFSVQRPADYQPLELKESGPVTVTQDGQIIENLSITAGKRDACAIQVKKAHNVVIRNVDIKHSNIGICTDRAENVLIQDVRLTSTSAQATGPHCKHGADDCKYNRNEWADPDTRLGIKLNHSPEARLERIFTTGASGGVYVHKSIKARVYDIVCTDARGPYPRGQCVQFAYSSDSQLKNFYSRIWKNQSWSEDNVNIYDSDRVLVEDGLIDGNYSVNGVGVIADHGSDYATVRNVDLLHTAVAAVSVWSNDESKVGKNFLAKNIRVKDTQCESRDKQTPSSQGLAFSVHPKAVDPQFINSRYFNHCRSTAMWCIPGAACRKAEGGRVDVREADFEPKAPLELLFPWEN